MTDTLSELIVVGNDLTTKQKKSILARINILDILKDKLSILINFLHTVTFLVEHGADRTICDENSKTPLELCRSKSEWEDIFNYLNSLESTHA